MEKKIVEMDGTMTVKKGCATCLYTGTHERCGTYSRDSHCFGNNEEIKQNDNVYLYRYYKEGNGAEELERWQKDGRVNIVIGGMGEAEVNVKLSPEETFENLCDVSEQCGYLTVKGVWIAHHKEIIISTEGTYKLTYFHDKLAQIDRINTTRTWTA